MSTMEFKSGELLLFTDGSASNRVAIDKRVGGYSAVIVLDKPIELSGAALGITSQQAEMLGVITGLAHIELNYPNSNVQVISDSAYIVNCFREKWYKGWIRNDWFFVKNREYWELLIELALKSSISVDFKWVKGHSGNQYNELADRLAGDARKNLEKTIQ